MKKPHNTPNCKCVACEQGIEELKKIQDKAILKYGWYAHFVMGDKSCPANTNAHTHHVQETFGHKDLQICLNIDPNVLHTIFSDIIEEIKNGVKFEPGKKYDRLLKNFKVEFIDAIECGRPVLRLLIPDKNGKYEGPYAVQLTKLDNTVNPNLNLN